MKYNYLIVGSGLFGAIFAYEAYKRGKKCLVIDKRSHIGGNIYTENIDGINVHKYGAHIFHTSNKEVWQYINQFAEFNRYTNSPVARYKDELYNMPFNMNTFNKLWGVVTPDQAKAKIEEEKKEAGITEPQNLEEQAISLVGKTIYEKLVKGYTEKQWGKRATELPSFIIKRLPIRFIYDTEYEVPYTRIIEHKHFEYGPSLGKIAEGEAARKTIITREYPDKWVQGKEPYYTMNDDKNAKLYAQYKELADKDNKVIFGGRLGQYKYFDMDKVIAEVLKLSKEELK